MAGRFFRKNTKNDFSLAIARFDRYLISGNNPAFVKGGSCVK